MISRALPCCAPLAAVGLVAGAWLAAAAEPQVAAKKPDWVGLDGLLAAGEYDRAAAAANEIVTAVRPKRRDTDYLPRTVELVRALMRRGVAELRLGQLDAAAETFNEAAKAFKDRDFQRLLNLESRAPSARALANLVLLDMSWVDLLDLRMAVILQRLRFLSLGDAADGPRSEEGEAELCAKIADWLKDYEVLERNAREARETLAERLPQGGEALLASPYNRGLAGRFRPALFAATKALELDRLPCGKADTAAAESATDIDLRSGRRGVEAARRGLQESAAALDQVIAAVAPKGVASLKTEPRIEAALMRADLLTCEAETLLAAGEPAAARERLTKSLELRHEVAVLRKLPRPETHPDLFWPLLLVAEATLAEAALEPPGEDPGQARGALLEAGKVLARADELPVPAVHPLRARLAALRAQLDAALAGVEARIPGKDAADAAARRARRALDRAGAGSAIFDP